MIIPSFSEKEILERVDEYSLYCFYLEFEPVIGGKYRSPLREKDDYASFGVYQRKSERKFGNNVFYNEFLWKDQALPRSRNFGDLFDLVQVLFELPTRVEAVWQVISDFLVPDETGNTKKKLINLKPTFSATSNIRVQSREFEPRDLSYWKRYNINEEILKEYNCTAVRYVFYTDEQQYPVTLYQAYAYRIHNKYQIYQPFASKELKFQNDWTDLHIPGWAQLRYTSLCIITKSYKDVMCLRSFGYDAVSPRAESIVLCKEALEYLDKRYSKVLVLFDNDGKHKGDSYPFDKVFIPLESGEKDVTDYCYKYGVEQTRLLLKQIFNDD